MSAQPSHQLLEHWVASLRAHLPFARMARDHVQQLALAAHERYFAPDAVIASPNAPLEHLIFLRQGRALGRRARAAHDVFELEAGGLFPVAALLAGRPASSTYSALDDCFCLFIPWAAASALMGASAPWADFLNQRMLAFLDDSRRRWGQELQAQVQQQRNLESPLAELTPRQPISRPAAAPLSEVLGLMLTQKVGSVLLTDHEGALSGILTRSDVLDRVALAGLALHTPASQIMSQPVLTIEAHRPVLDAALMMSRHGLRHLPVMDQGRLLSIVSERDLFALQNQSIKHVSGAIWQAQSLEQLQHAAARIRAFAAHLMAQGVQSRPLTRLISQLNDSLTERVIALALQRHGLSAQQMCWVALGSEGRGEQTIATDQDNALIFESDDPARDQPAWLAFAADVNHTLDACGFPLCTGGVMACNAPCCLTRAQWGARFAQWIEQGSPEDLLKASVFFDFRALAGRADWLAQLGQQVRQQALQTPRFMAQWARNHLARSVPLNWHGGFDTHRDADGHEVIDIKLSGTALLVDAARILAFAQGIDAVSTVERLERASDRLGIPESEYRGWVTAFDYLQLLRLRHQLEQGLDPRKANSLRVDALNLVDRQILKASFAAIRGLQQRLELDYVR
jgi:CBS domain-containing protein